MIKDFKIMGKGFLYFLLYLFLPNILLIPMTLFGIKFSSFSNNIQGIINLAVYIVMAFVFAFIYRKILKKDAGDFKKNYKKYLKISLKYWLIGFIVMLISNFIINFILYSGSMATNEAANRKILGTMPFFSIPTLIIIAPFIEELIFRAGFKNAFKSAIAFAIFSALIFGGIHIINSYTTDMSLSIHELLYIIPYGSLGFSLGYIYFKTNNIYSSIAIHMFHNCLVVLSVLLTGVL